jgi:hypothetical protein
VGRPRPFAPKRRAQHHERSFTLKIDIEFVNPKRTERALFDDGRKVRKPVREFVAAHASSTLPLPELNSSFYRRKRDRANRRLLPG